MLLLLLLKEICLCYTRNLQYNDVKKERNKAVKSI